jgi:uncharacterized Zn-finger protein
MNQQINFKSIDILNVSIKKVSCDGDGRGSKHPLIYLNMGKKDHAICPYCNRYFSLQNPENSTDHFNKNKKN